MVEINKLYGKDSGAAASSSSKSRSKTGAAANNEEQKQETFDTGFDHGFDSMATFNGKSVGKDEGPKVSASVVDKE